MYMYVCKLDPCLACMTYTVIHTLAVHEHVCGCVHARDRGSVEGDSWRRKREQE